MVVPIWTGPVHGRHGSLALALVGTRPSFWSHHQAERGSDVLIDGGSFLWTNPSEERRSAKVLIWFEILISIRRLQRPLG